MNMSHNSLLVFSRFYYFIASWFNPTNHGKVAKVTSEWTPREGKRVRGRPKRRWRDNIEEVGGSQWMRVAQNRNAWRELWRPSASSGMNG